MAVFTYKTYDARGELREGEIAAPTRQAALDALHRQGTTPVSIAEGAMRAGTGGAGSSIRRGRGRLTSHALMLLTRELATLTTADLTLEDALRIVELQPSLPAPARRLIADVLERVMGGAALSDAFAAQDGDIPPAYCRLLAAGERSGNLAAALTALATDLERNEKLRAELRSAMIYPLTLLIAAVATLALIIAVLIPALMPLFEEARSTPPVIVAALDALRRFAVAHWTWALPALTAIPIVALLAGRNAALAGTWDRLILSLPIVGGLVQRRETGRFAGTLATLLKNGVAPLEAIRVAGNANANSLYRDAARQAEQHLANGGQLSEILERTGLFAPLALRMTVVGERTGQLDVMLARLQELEETALQRELQRLVSVLAPALTIAIGILVGGILISVMGAIVGLNDLAFR